MMHKQSESENELPFRRAKMRSLAQVAVLSALLALSIACQSDRKEPVEAGAKVPDAAVQPPNDASKDSGSGELVIVELSSTEPKKISETGLFSKMSPKTIAPGVEAFVPKFPLWSDGAEKERWIQLPEGQKIDSAEGDYWNFPIGTKVWKHFYSQGKLIETRYIARYGLRPTSWIMAAYIWNDDESEAYLSELGEENVRGTEHDVPGIEACGECHLRYRPIVLGFSAFQLADLDPVKGLSHWSDKEWFSVPLADADFQVAGDAVEQAALGYFHSNCGSCHNPSSPVNARVEMLTWLIQEQQSQGVALTSSYLTMVNAATTHGSSVEQYRLEGGSSSRSEMLRRMELSGLDRMPPLGTELPDTQGIKIIEDWVSRLPAPTAP